MILLAPSGPFQFSNHMYQYINDKFIFHFDGEKLVGVFEKRNGAFNKVDKKEDAYYSDKGLNEFKAIIQQYNKALINNSLVERPQ